MTEIILALGVGSILAVVVIYLFVIKGKVMITINQKEYKELIEKDKNKEEFITEYRDKLNLSIKEIEHVQTILDDMKTRIEKLTIDE